MGSGRFRSGTNPYLQTTQHSSSDNRFNEGASGANAIAIPINYAPNLTQVMPQAMANGTQMSGTATQNEFRAEVVGNTTDQTHPFRITIQATRSG
jgi:hypothetical protein